MLVATVPLAAQTVSQITLNSGNVIGGSQTLNGLAFNAGAFTATNVVDEQTGTIGSEVFFQNYWLGLDGSTTGYFVLDLGAATQIAQLSLFNTHNGPDGDDRSTATFHVAAANSVTFVDALHGFDLVSGTTILSSSLPLPDNTPLVENIFTSGNGLNIGGINYRYIRFTYDSIAGPPGRGPNGGGLHEIRVFTAVPEPSTYALIGGVAAGAVVLLRRRSSVA